MADTAWRPAGLEVHVAAPDDLDLPMPIATAFLRIAQGAMANVGRHADAREASLEVSHDGDGYALEITDDGRGFDPQAVTWGVAGASESFGLQAIGDRVRALGGILELDAAPGRGTRLRVEVPHESDRVQARYLEFVGSLDLDVGQGWRRHPVPAGQIPGMTPARGPAIQESQRVPGHRR